MIIKIGADKILTNHKNLKKSACYLKADRTRIVMIIKIGADKILINHKNLKKSACYLKS
jgi:hypothetical protein